MKNSKLLKIGSFMLCATLLAGVLVAPQKVSASTEQVTYIDFEDGVNPFTKGREGANTKTGNTWSDNIAVKEMDDGNSALCVTSKASTEYTSYLTEGWASGTRPTEVNYKLKIVNTGKIYASKRAFVFSPIYTHTKYTGYGYLSSFRFTTIGTGLAMKAASTAMSQNCSGTESKSVDLNMPITEDVNTSPWYELTCKYDWSKYNADNNYQLSVSIIITDGEGKVYNNSQQVFTGNSTSTIAKMSTDTLSFGFLTSNVDGFSAYVDDISIWSENFTTGETYGPTVSPEAIGASLSNVIDNKVKVKMNFDFTSAKELIKKNGETVQKYGAVLVAGTKDGATMQSKASTMIANGLSDSDGYKRTEKTGELADQYAITITNSCETDTMGKRASAIGYVVTDKGIYYTNNTVANKVTNGVINKSVMGLLKSIFSATYLADYDAQIAEGASIEATRLGIALHACGYEVTSDVVAGIRTITTKSGSTAEEKQQLLKLHIALMSE